MEQLEMIKAFAELEGIPSRIDTDCNGVKRVLLPNSYCNENKCSFVYNPITDLALNCAARDKYKVEIKYLYNGYQIQTFNGDFDAEVFCSDRLERAIIECILKSTGKWV